MGSGSFLKVLAKNFDVLAGYGLRFPSPLLPPLQRSVDSWVLHLRCGAILGRVIRLFCVSGCLLIPAITGPRGCGESARGQGISLCRLLGRGG